MSALICGSLAYDTIMGESKKDEHCSAPANDVTRMSRPDSLTMDG